MLSRLSEHQIKMIQASLLHIVWSIILWKFMNLRASTVGGVSLSPSPPFPNLASPKRCSGGFPPFDLLAVFLNLRRISPQSPTSFASFPWAPCRHVGLFSLGHWLLHILCTLSLCFWSIPLAVTLASFDSVAILTLLVLAVGQGWIFAFDWGLVVRGGGWRGGWLVARGGWLVARGGVGDWASSLVS